MSITEQPAPHLTLYRATGAKPSPDLHPNGVNHLALSTADMKAQLTFFAEVLGCPTRALYWMHGVPNTFHGFVELSGDSYIAFVQAPGNPTEPLWGVTHSGNAGNPVTAGTMQHVAFNVDSIDDLLTIRDRIRSHGIQVMGPLDHGMIQSIYFAGPEHLSASRCASAATSTSDSGSTPRCRTSVASPTTNSRASRTPPDSTVRTSRSRSLPYDPSTPNLRYPDPIREAIMGMPDADLWNNLSESTPPVALD